MSQIAYRWLSFLALLSLVAFGSSASLARVTAITPAEEPTPLPTTDGFINSPLYQQFLMDQLPAENLAPLAYTPCVGGLAGTYPCNKVDLLSFLPLANMGGGNGNVVWGWTDPLTGKEYALFGRSNGTAFVEVTTPTVPLYLGNLPSHTGSSSWRDIRVYQNYAYVVADNNGAHGMQVFDLTQLRSVASPPVTFSESGWYNGVAGNVPNNIHSLFINEDTGFAYAPGSASCSGGLHMINLQNPVSPTFAGCYSASGYTHETQCVAYNGPDLTYQNHEICFNSNGRSGGGTDAIVIVDVTNKLAPTPIYTVTYAGAGYTHQTWLTADQSFMLLNDELDEQNFGHNTRTRIFDITNLDAPTLVGWYDGPTLAIDHNLYIKEGLVYEANYRAGLRILDGAAIAFGTLSEIGYFDIYPSSNSAAFNGAWMAYPFFGSGTIAISGIEQGLFLVKFVSEADFSLAASPSQFNVCSSGELTSTVVINALDANPLGNVALTALNLPSGTSATFSVNPVTTSGNSILTTTVTTATAGGSYAITVQAVNAFYTRTTPISLSVTSGVPVTPSLLLPADGAQNQSLAPNLVWNSVSQASSYYLEVATDAAFTNVVYSTTLAQTSHTLGQLLADDTDHYWRVRANNFCGVGESAAPRSFRTRLLPPVLLVDDDNGLNVRSYYTSALEALGVTYDVWTVNASVEPTTQTLQLYDAVIWFSGDAAYGIAGPDNASETALGQYLDGSGCFLLSSQSYYQNQTTTFMTNHLGVLTATANANYTSVTGAGLYTAVGNQALTFPGLNNSDKVVADTGAETAFSYSGGAAGVLKATGTYTSTFLAFPAEALPTPARNMLVYQFLTACNLPALDPTLRMYLPFVNKP